MKTSAEIRRENARVLAEQSGGQAKFARLLEMSDSQMGQLIGKTPVRNIGPKIARAMEQASGKPEGWLDVPQSRGAHTSLRALQLQEAMKILEKLSDADLSRALGWLQAQEIKNDSHLTSEKVNHVTAEENGKIHDVPSNEVSLQGSSEGYEAAQERRRRLFRYSGATQSTEKHGKKGA